jgi:hypothetical protein
LMPLLSIYSLTNSFCKETFMLAQPKWTWKKTKQKKNKNENQGKKFSVSKLKIRKIRER